MQSILRNVYYKQMSYVQMAIKKKITRMDKLFLIAIWTCRQEDMTKEYVRIGSLKSIVHGGYKPRANLTNPC